MIATAVHDRRLGPASAPAPGARAHPGLSPDEEVELAGGVARGDQQARDRMVQANLALVRTIAQHFLGRGMEMDDLVGEGHLGLFRAAEKFDPRHGVRFSTYAAYWIKEAIRSALIKTAPAIRLPAYMVRLLTRWRRAERALRREGTREPGFDEVADSLGLTEEQRGMVAKALEARRLRCGADSGGEQADRFLAELPDRHGRVEERAEAQDEWEMVRRRLDRLDDRERAVVEWRYGLDGEALTLKEIGRRLGMTPHWACKLRLRALDKLAEAQAVEGRAPGIRGDQFEALGSGMI